MKNDVLSLENFSRGKIEALVSDLTDMMGHVYAENLWLDQLMDLNGKRIGAGSPIKIDEEAKKILAARIKLNKEILYKNYVLVAKAMMALDPTGESLNDDTLRIRDTFVTNLDPNFTAKMENLKEQLKKAKKGGEFLEEKATAIKSFLRREWFKPLPAPPKPPEWPRLFVTKKDSYPLSCTPE